MSSSTSRRAYVEDVTNEDDDFSAPPRRAPLLSSQPKPARKLAPLPLGAERVIREGRYHLLPELYKIESHSQVPHGGRIYMGVMDYHEEAMAKLLKHVVKQKPAKDEADIARQGYLILEVTKNDYLVLRDKYGTGLDEDDKVTTWSNAKTDLADEIQKRMDEVTGQILGPDAELAFGPEGTAFQRSDRAVPLKSGPSCYPFGLTAQLQKSMSAPAASTKVYSVKKDPAAELQYNCLQLGSIMSMEALRKGPPKLLATATKQAKLTNLLHVGTDRNVAFVGWQGNIATAVEPAKEPSSAGEAPMEIDGNGGVEKPSEVEPAVAGETPMGVEGNGGTGEPSEEPKNTDDVPMEVDGNGETEEPVEVSKGADNKGTENDIKDLGSFGSPHKDKHDAKGLPTAMNNLSRDHPDIPPQYFFLFDLGVCWKLDPGCTICFYGLHYHCGMKIEYKPVREKPDIMYKRVTIIAYPQGLIVNGQDTIAWAALTNNVLLPVGHELRDPATAHMLSERPHTTQATYVTDAGNIAEPISQLRHFGWCALQLLSHVIRQANPALLPRIDADKFLESISFNIDGIRTRCPPWEFAPAWRGEDVRLGKDYRELLKRDFDVEKTEDLEPVDLARLCNSDNHRTDHPYDNSGITEALHEWNDHSQKSGESIPICVVAKEGEEALGTRSAQAIAGARQAAANAAKSGKDLKLPKKKSGKRKGDKAGLDAPPNPKRARTDLIGNGWGWDDDRYDNDLDFDSNDKIISPNSDVESEDEPEGPPVVAQTASRTGDKEKKIFLDGLTLPALEVLKKTAIGASVSKHHKNAIALVSKSALDITSNPFTKKTRKTAIAMGTAIGSIRVNQWVNTANLLLSNMLLWEWLDTKLTEAYHDHSKDAKLSKLLVRLTGIFTKQPKKVVLDARTFFPGFEKGECLKTYEFTRRFADPDVSPTSIIEKATYLMAEWFKFPKVDKYRGQAWFVRAMINKIDPRVLLLKPVAGAMTQIPVSVLGQTHNYKVTQRRLAEWVTDVLEEHPIANSESSLSRLASEIYKLIEDIQPINPKLIERALTEQPVQREPEPEPEPEPADGELPAIDEDKFDFFATLFIETLAPLVDSTQPLPPIHTITRNSTLQQKRDTAIRRFILDTGENDKKNPFRQLGPSLSRILQPGGPAALENLRTPAGLFSRLIHRGVTHNTPYLRDGNQVLFKDLAEWNEVYKSLLPQAEEYFCNMSAYGQCAKARSVEKIPTYWEIANDPEFNFFLEESEEPHNIVTVFRYFLNDKHHIPAFGSLTLYQLLADYSQDGVLSKPTAEEMATILKLIGKGGLNGLKALGFTCSSHP
ncbi:hypothetical protein GALMADRAFT_148171, partial [Galerina marginata CBS 339.88]